MIISSATQEVHSNTGGCDAIAEGTENIPVIKSERNQYMSNCVVTLLEGVTITKGAENFTVNKNIIL